MVVSVCHAQISLKTLSVSWIETHQTFFLSYQNTDSVAGHTCYEERKNICSLNFILDHNQGHC